jgi:hypothetical protein
MATRTKPIVPRKLEPKEYPDTPMQGWRDRRAVQVPAEILEAARIGRERLAAREEQRQVTAPGDGGVGGTSLRSARPS